MTKLSIKNIIYLPILFFFLPSFALLLPGTSKVVTFLNFSLYIALSIMFYTEGVALLRRFIYVCKKTPLIFYILFILLSCLDIIFLSIFGSVNITKSIVSILLRYFLVILPILLYFIGLLTKYLSLKQFFKVFIMGLWINAILGIIAYISLCLNISIINSIFDFFNNSRAISSGITGLTVDNAAALFEKKRRLTGLYAEPGYLGRFIFLFLPFVYTFGTTKLKLFKNSNIDLWLKRTIIPLTWINLILTLSPINLIFSCFITFIYFINPLIRFLKKHFLLFLILILMIVFVALNFELNLSETYLMRIINVVTSLNSFSTLIVVEPSLATRLVYYINTFVLFLHHPFSGIGINNIPYYIYHQCIVSPVPLTPEIIWDVRLQISQGNTSLLTTPIPCFYSALVENGLFIALIFFYFICNVYLSIRKIYIKIQKNSFHYLISKSLFYSFICFIIEFFYEVTFTLIQFNLFLSMCVVFILSEKINLLNQKDKEISRDEQ